MDVGLSCVAKKKQQEKYNIFASPYQLSIKVILPSIISILVQPYRKYTNPSMFILYFDVHEKNEKNSFSFFFSFMQHLFLTYNTTELDNI